MRKYLIALFLGVVSTSAIFASEQSPDSDPAQFIVCTVADNSLDEGTRAQVDALLARTPSMENFLSLCMEATTVRRTESIAYVPRSVGMLTNFECLEDDVCLTHAMHRDSMALANKTEQPERRLKLIGYVSRYVHLMHLPLSFGAEDDKSGTTITVVDRQNCASNLREYWQKCLIGEIIADRDLETAAADLSAAIHFKDRKRWQQQAAILWANESLDILRMPEMGYCTMNKGVCRYSRRSEEYVPLSSNMEPSTKPTEDTVHEATGPTFNESRRSKAFVKTLTLNKHYRQWAAKVYQIRLQQAGVRLAQTLKNIFDAESI